MKKGLNKKELSRELSTSRLTAAAFELFVVRGYHATSLEAISSKAGLTKGAVYFYFGSKENLILHMFEALEKNIVIPLVQAVQEGDGYEDSIIRYIHRGANFGAERPHELLFMIKLAIEFTHQEGPISIGIKTLYDKVYAALEEALNKAQEQGALSQEIEPRAFASMIVAVHDGMMLEWHLRATEISGPRLVKYVRHMLLHGIKGSGMD